MSWGTIISIIIHLIIFVVWSRFVKKQKGELSKENARLTTENRKQKGEISYLTALLSDEG